jgi:hypothetical protein
MRSWRKFVDSMISNGAFARDPNGLFGAVSARFWFRFHPDARAADRSRRGVDDFVDEV